MLSARHRRCLRNGCLGGPAGENEAQLYTGHKVREECVENGWLERMPDTLMGVRMYRTTELGRQVLNTLVEKKPSRRHRVKMLEPRIRLPEARLKPQ